MQTITAAVILLFISSGALRAAETVPAKLSLGEAVSIALEANVRLKSAEEARLSSLSRLRVANLLTSTDAVSTTSLEHAPNESGLSGRAYTDVTYENLMGTQASLAVSPLGWGNDRGSLGLSIRHPLTTGRGILSRKGTLVESAHSAVRIQQRGLYMSRQSVVVQVIEAYYRAVLAREQVEVQERAIAIAEEALDGARKREEAGLIAGIEVSRAETNLAQTKDALNVQRASARGALDRLMLAIGQGVGQTPELTDAVPDVNPETPDAEEAIEVALANRSELAVYDERLADQERELAISEDELRPALDIVGQFTSTNSGTGFISGSILDRGYSAAGVELRLPLDKRAIREERDTAARALDILREQRVFETEQIAEEVRGACRSLESARTSLSIYSENVDVAKDRLRLAQRMVEEGEGSNREVLEAQESLTRVESGLLSAKADLYLATVNLRYAMGEDLTIMGSL